MSLHIALTMTLFLGMFCTIATKQQKNRTKWFICLPKRRRNSTYLDINIFMRCIRFILNTMHRADHGCFLETLFISWAQATIFFLFFFIVLQFILHIKSSSICMHCSSTRAYIQIWMNSFVCGCTKWLWALNVNINHYFYLIFITYFREKLILFTLQMAQSQTK